VITRSYGSGSPVTLVAHGLGATAGEARIPASGLPGTRVVVTLPSHADAPGRANESGESRDHRGEQGQRFGGQPPE